MEENAVKRIMPHDNEAEQSVIGAMILDNESISAVEGILEPGDFYQKQFAVIFEAIQELNSERKPVDLLTLKAKLSEKAVPPEISNMTYIGDLIANVPISANAKYYAEIVKEKSTLRKLIHTSEDIATDCYAGKTPLDEIMEKTEKDVFSILNQGKAAEYVPIGQTVIDVVERIHKAGENKNPITGVPSGFIDLDRKTTGFHESELIIIAARPAMGKTAFVLNIAQHVALTKGEPLAIFSLEMSREQLVSRLLAMGAKIDAQSIRTGELGDDEWVKLGEAAGYLGRSQIIIDDTSGISINELRTRCRKYKLEKDIKLIIIDYMQLMGGSNNRRNDSRQQEISEISRALKGIARELGVPVIALSQLSRGPESRTDKRPMMSDLRESGSIEQDADVVMFIYRDDYYNSDSEKKNVAEIILAKQRQGPIGTVELGWQPNYTRFVNLERGER